MHELETLRARVVSAEREIVTLRARAEDVEQRAEITRDSLGIDGGRILEFQYRVGDAEARVHQGEITRIGDKV
ncbi:hypothetical protein Tco_0585507 [Tanacetum coccineum]